MNEPIVGPSSELVWIPNVDAAWPFRGGFPRSWPDDLARFSRSFWRFDAFPRFRSEVTDQGDAYAVVAELPGIPKDRIQVTLQGSRLRIVVGPAPSPPGGTTEPSATTAPELLFERAIEFPEPVDASTVRAKAEDGVLTVTVPKPKPLPEARIPLA